MLSTQTAAASTNTSTASTTTPLQQQQQSLAVVRRSAPINVADAELAMHRAEAHPGTTSAVCSKVLFWRYGNPPSSSGAFRQRRLTYELAVKCVHYGTDSAVVLDRHENDRLNAPVDCGNNDARPAVFHHRRTQVVGRRRHHRRRGCSCAAETGGPRPLGMRRSELAQRRGPQAAANVCETSYAHSALYKSCMDSRWSCPNIWLSASELSTY